MGTVSTSAQSIGSAAAQGISSGSATASAIGTINQNAQQQLAVSQAQSNASLLQSLGEAMKSGASSIQKAAQAS